MKIWIDDEEVVNSIENGIRSFIVVPNGDYTIQTGSSWVDRGNIISFSVNDEEIIFMAQPVMGVFSARFRLSETARKSFIAAQ